MITRKEQYILANDFIEFIQINQKDIVEDREQLKNLSEYINNFETPLIIFIWLSLSKICEPKLTKIFFKIFNKKLTTLLGSHDYKLIDEYIVYNIKNNITEEERVRLFFQWYQIPCNGYIDVPEFTFHQQLV